MKPNYSYYSSGISSGDGITKDLNNNRSKEKISHFIIPNESLLHHTLDKTLMDDKRAIHGLCLLKNVLTLPCSSYTTAAKVVVRTGKQKNQENSFQS